jgi:hypothetical protein
MEINKSIFTDGDKQINIYRWRLTNQYLQMEINKSIFTDGDKQINIYRWR